MNIGFTGTQRGFTLDQRNKFFDLIIWYDEVFKISSFHHGDCIGADSDAHYIVNHELDNTIIIIHPPINSSKRAFCKGNEILKPKDYIERNHDIVDSVEVLIACPKEFAEIQRSGTWATIRYAKARGKKVKIIWPDGGMDEWNGKVPMR